MSNDKHQFQDLYPNTGIFHDSNPSLMPTLSQHDGVDHQIQNGGCDTVFNCPSCGVPIKITIEWPEIVAMKYGVNPYHIYSQAQFSGLISGQPISWKFVPNEQAWTPEMKCSVCNWASGLRVKPQELEPWLNEGRRRGFINFNAERDISTLCDRMAQQLRGQPVMPRR